MVSDQLQNICFIGSIEMAIEANDKEEAKSDLAMITTPH